VVPGAADFLEVDAFGGFSDHSELDGPVPAEVVVVVSITAGVDRVVGAPSIKGALAVEDPFVLHVGLNEDGPVGASIIVKPAGHDALVIVLSIHGGGRTDLSQVAEAACFASGFPRLCENREQDSG